MRVKKKKAEVAEPTPGETPPAAPSGPSCILDDAPVNAKIVVVRDEGKAYPILATPAGSAQVPEGDMAWKLPLGARIRRVATVPRGTMRTVKGQTTVVATSYSFVSDQLDAVEDRDPLYTATAADACAQFVPHFHGP